MIAEFPLEAVKMSESIDFEVISSQEHSVPWDTRFTVIRTVRCPRCGNVFSQKGEGGCFGISFSPPWCECGFPWPERDSPSSNKNR